MMPHIRLPSSQSTLTSAFAQRLWRDRGRPLALDPPFDIALLAGADGQGPWRYVLTHRRARSDIRALSNRHGSNQLRIAADERAVLDHRALFLLPVVVADDGAGTDVDVGADLGVPEVRQVAHLGAGPERRLL